MTVVVSCNSNAIHNNDLYTDIIFFWFQVKQEVRKQGDDIHSDFLSRILLGFFYYFIILYVYNFILNEYRFDLTILNVIKGYELFIHN